jgi:solute carrier family 12 (sodium/potassium/chloride transporter), member 2
VTPGAGGAYALVARSFGVEAGGAVGVSLYLSQSLVIVLYIFGFRDGWLTIFPGHPALAVDVLAVLFLIGIAVAGTKAAFRVQFLILAVVGAALASVAVAAVTGPLSQTPELVGEFPGAPEDAFAGTDAFAVFAVFFPATTGIMAGLNMSGELREPRRSIRAGTLAAVGVSVVIYLAVAVWFAFAVPTAELVTDYFVMVERAAWGPAVLAGLLTATLSSALASLVGAPRILHALADDRLTPASTWLAQRDRKGEPRQALIVTIVVVASAVLLRDLNAIAPLITMVFLLIYGAINLAVLAELAVDLPSYRPTFRVPWPVPLVGVVGCLGAMVVIDLRFTVLALAAVVVVLLWLSRRDVERPVTDVRAALLLSSARWATRTARRIAPSGERTWAPRFLVPVADDEDVDRVRSWLPELVQEGEHARLVPITTDGTENGMRDAVASLREQLEGAGVDASASRESVEGAAHGLAVALVAVGDEDDPNAANVVVAGFPDRPDHDRSARRLLRHAFDVDAGVAFVPRRPPERDGDQPPTITLWVRSRGPRWQLDDHLPHSDLALLLAYRLAQAWDASLALVTAIGDSDDADAAEEYLSEVAERARLPGPPELRVIRRSFDRAVEDPPAGTLHVLALSSQTDFEWLREIRDRLDAPCLFVRDSGVENAFA